MARIRSIKPEFPQSESIGRLSRDARLLFILLWTIADDSGITRGSSRMLASLLYPYDEDSPKLLDGWLSELDRESCIARYAVEGQTYLKILNWNKHQRIDKPTPSKFPQFVESSRILANPPEEVANPLGGIGLDWKGIGKERKGKDKPTAVVASAPTDPLYQAVWQSFIAKTKTFTNYPKEAQATKRIISYAKHHGAGDGIDFSRAVITKYWELIESGDKFWSKQPFTPSALSILFDRVIAELRQSTDRAEEYKDMAEGVEF